jgi:hypothetical protein
MARMAKTGTCPNSGVGRLRGSGREECRGVSTPFAEATERTRWAAFERAQGSWEARKIGASGIGCDATAAMLCEVGGCCPKPQCLTVESRSGLL